VLIKKDKEIKDIDYTLSIKSTSSSENILLYLILNYDKFNRILVHNFYGDRPDIQEVITFCNKCGLNIYYDQQTLSKIEDQKTMISSISFTIISDFDQILFYIFL
jgi:UDP-N-acetylglucosamine enolpyruvyl transferase